MIGSGGASLNRPVRVRITCAAFQSIGSPMLLSAAAGRVLFAHGTIAARAAPETERIPLTPEDPRSEERRHTTDVDPSIAAGRPQGDPRPAAVSFATTEHFTLQGARGSTIAESTGRASMFLLSVSGGLVALGLIATASRVGTAFYAFGLILLPTLTFVGFATFERAVQSGIEDLGYARRIALLRGYYFDQAPELAPYLMSVPEPKPLRVLGLSAGRGQAFRTVAAMVAVITAVLAGAAIGLLTAVAWEHSLAAALVAGGVVALAALAAMMRIQQSAWERAASAPVSFDADDTGATQR
jgi:hypothetical protein